MSYHHSSKTLNFFGVVQKSLQENSVLVALEALCRQFLVTLSHDSLQEISGLLLTE